MTPIYPAEASWEVAHNVIDVMSFSGSYQMPVSRETRIELLFLSDVNIPLWGIINLMNGNYSRTVKYHIAEKTWTGYDLTYVVSLIGHGKLLEGEHAPKICQVRYDLGDGTYRELYAHENEKETIIERHYNRKNLWL